MKAFSLAVRTTLVSLALAVCWAVTVYAQQGSGFKFLEVKVTDPDGKPVAEASVEVTMDGVTFPMPTDDKGMISLNVPGGGNSSLQLKVQKEGFASVTGNWGGGAEIPTEIAIALAPGFEIGGGVQDEQGNPVEGVTVEVSGTQMNAIRAFNLQPGQMQASLTGQLGVTDAEGRWRYPGAAEPDGASQIVYFLHLSHPDYANDNNSHRVDFEKLRAKDHVLVLKKGIELRGTITDPDGKPVAGAKIALGSELGQKDNTKNTDQDGKYLFGNVVAGQTVMTIYSPDFSPELKVVPTSKGMSSVDVQLKKGKPMKIRVTDPDGKPISNAGVVADTWRGYRTLYMLGQPERTDGEGMCVWENAPEEPMQYDFWHDSHMSLRGQMLTAGDEVHEIVLPNPVVVKGTVTDAVTGRPIELFNTVEGIRWNAERTDIYWERYNLQTGRDGKFEMRFTEPRGAHLVRIEAHGYKPATSREIKDGEGEVALEFKLEAGTGPSGVVKLPDGSPAAGAQIVLASGGGQISIINGEETNQDGPVRTVADAEGKYNLPFPDSDYAVVFLHDGGWAQVTGSELERAPNITLNKWAQLKGVVKVTNRTPAAERVMINYNDQTFTPSGPNVHWSYNTTTDNDGNFSLDRLKAGEANVGRIVAFGVGDMQMSTFSHSVPVTLSAGEDANVEIGGAGLKIRGKIVAPEEYDGPNPWSMGQVSLHEQATQVSGAAQLFFEMGKAMAQNNAWNPAIVARQKKSPAQLRSYAATIDQDGVFQIDDVLPGNYGLNVMVYTQPSGESHNWSMLGTANGSVSVPEQGEGPVDAGELMLQLQQQQPTGQWSLQPAVTIQAAPAPVDQ